MSVKIGRNDPCWCKSGKKYKACHQAFDEKIARIRDAGHIVPSRTDQECRTDRRDQRKCEDQYRSSGLCSREY